MNTVKIHDLVQKRVLVARETARTLERDLAAALAEGDGEVVLDFDKIGGLAPSFFDEMLTIIGEYAQGNGDGCIDVRIENPPTHFSSEFEAVTRVHGLTMHQSDIGAWVIRGRDEEPPTGGH